MKIPLSSYNHQTKMDFTPKRKGVVVYNERMDLIGFLTGNEHVELFILLNHDVEQYGDEGFSDAIVASDRELKQWTFVGFM